MGDVVLTRRGSIEVSEDELIIRHTMTAYARNVLASWHGVVWAVFSIAFISNTLAARTGISGIIAGIAQVTVLFCFFLGGMHILRFREKPGTREHMIPADSITSIETDVAMNAETPHVLSKYTVNYEKDGEHRKAIVLPLKRYQDRFSEVMKSGGYSLQQG